MAEEISQELRAKLDEMAQRIENDPDFKQKIQDDPEGTLRAEGVSQDEIQNLQASASQSPDSPDVQGYGYWDSCWTWTSIRCGGGGGGGGSARPQTPQIPQNPWGGGRLITPSGSN